MTKSGEVIFSHYFNYQAKCGNQLHNDGCWAREGERQRQGERERGKDGVREVGEEGSKKQKKDRKWKRYLH